LTSIIISLFESFCCCCCCCSFSCVDALDDISLIPTIDDDVDVVLDERRDDVRLLVLIDEYRRGAIGGGPLLL